jgi:hypothetical protein
MVPSPEEVTVEPLTRQAPYKNRMDEKISAKSGAAIAYFVSGTATSSSMLGWRVISIRRFFARFCGVSFGAMGSNSP